MASFLRARQAGIQNDLSAGIPPGSFSPDELFRYGINSQISCLAYDPIQSLLAVGTHASRYGAGKIYVFGARRVVRSFSLTSSSSPSPPAATSSAAAEGVSVRQLSFVANRLVSLDSRNELAVWSLHTGEKVARSSYGRVSCVLTDPGLDWAFVGLQAGGGEVWAYDLDRERPAAGFRLPNFWRAKVEREKGSRPGGLGGAGLGLGLGVEIVSLQLHPRDIGKLLIGYTHGAVVYSFKQNAVQRYFEYVVPAGAPGGNGEGMEKERRPKLVRALWHPSGTFVLTAHEDGSLVFWDPKDGRVVAARSVYHTRVNEVGGKKKGEKPTPRAPFGRIAWCCKQNSSDDTALLIAGGQALDEQDKGLTFLELGPTPIYATSSWEVLTNHFEGKRRLTLPIPPGAEVADFCLIPRSSPFFDGAQDPIAVLVLLTSGEVLTMSFPSGYPISPTNMLHPSMSFVHPFVQKIAVSTMPREKWLGLVETRDQGDPILMGGAPAAKRRRAGCDFRNIIQVAHADSTIRIWDVGFNDDIENPGQLQADVARALDRFEDVSVTALAMADATGELAAGTRTGEVVIYRWGINRNYGRDATKPIDPNPGGLSDISSRSSPSLKEGLQPFVLYEMMQGPVSVVTVSDVGFVAVGSEGGFFSIIDLRGPTIIYHASITEFIKEEKRSSFLKGHSSKASTATKEFPTVVEFGVMTNEGDSYSSIDCFVGTNLGRVATFKILPAGQTYSAQLAGVAKVGHEKVVAICPVNADTGQPASATGLAVAGLSQGRQVNGVLVVVTQTEIRIFKPAAAKGASKSFEDQLCDAARVTEFPGHGVALVAVFGDRTTRAYSLPSLKEIGRASLPMLDPSRTISTVISRTGEILGWTGPSEIAVLPVWPSSGKGLQPPLEDTLINPELVLPPRPTISNLQWISGTQYVSPTDLDLLIGGEGRPPSKRMMEAAAAERGMAGGADGGGSGGARAAGTSQEGWGEYLTRQLNERTERLNIVDDAMSRLQETSQGWAEDVNKFVKKQKRDMLLGSVKKSLF
ncbi:lethal giant larvae like, C-terminal-domain-containing protein [Achaetomium macrosporum]|uniref:Lethal giant larvae like, C-terminal-domain-containing protein n=1 Tax=Achaetomium macrosporum TaxID=79813 RepID=A0AAN7CIX2_9PEZI|nr:lethal giant larvae like, C-terminal-domain-containing protein [Achaetomium macrosporum]